MSLDDVTDSSKQDKKTYILAPGAKKTSSAYIRVEGAILYNTIQCNALKSICFAGNYVRVCLLVRLCESKHVCVCVYAYGT